jgi:diketogulonate reductase-like aldo/keto reductase
MERFIYGTAWKKEKTKEYVIDAIKNGFRAIDTACQPKHYNEAEVGKGIKEAMSICKIPREKLFIQTKFTPVTGQDPNSIPYNPNDPIEMQVEQSVKRSLENLQIDYIDSLLLHSPISPHIDMLKAWRVLEMFVLDGKIGQLGVSNYYEPEFFKYFYRDVLLKPKVIQNRFYKQSNYDVELREFASLHRIEYQSFWSLTANINHLTSDYFVNIVKKYDKTPEQIFYRFLIQSGITPLNGTTSIQHMKEDFEVFSFEIDSTDMAIIETYLYN